MKKTLIAILCITMGIFISACSNKTEIDETINKEGIWPYELSENNTDLLQSLGLENAAKLIKFKAPKEAKMIKVSAYILEDEKWRELGRGEVLLGKEDVDSILEGTFAMLLKDDYSIDMHINTMGRASFKTESIEIDNEVLASARASIAEYKEIELNKEIPVAIMAYDSGNSIRAFEMESFFTENTFKDMDLVQAVTLTFSDSDK